MRRQPIVFGALLAMLLVVAGSIGCARQDGALIELDRTTAFDELMAMPGVVLVDCFADW